MVWLASETLAASYCCRRASPLHHAGRCKGSPSSSFFPQHTPARHEALNTNRELYRHLVYMMALHETCTAFRPFPNTSYRQTACRTSLHWIGPAEQSECLLPANLVLMLLLLLLLSVCFGHGGGSSRGMHSHSIARGGAHEPIVRACAHMCMTYTRARVQTLTADIGLCLEITLA